MQGISFFLMLLLAAGSLPAQTSPQLPSCNAPEYRQFDFWVGDWNVYATDSLGNEKLIGTNNIEIGQDSCLLQENWGAEGMNNTGTSLNYYDRADGNWHQLWVSNSGTILNLKGGLEGNSMILYSEEMLSREGKPYINRISWIPNTDGSVRQHWEVSSDKESWRTVFDGLYRLKMKD